MLFQAVPEVRNSRIGTPGCIPVFFGDFQAKKRLSFAWIEANFLLQRPKSKVEGLLDEEPCVRKSIRVDKRRHWLLHWNWYIKCWMGLFTRNDISKCPAVRCCVLFIISISKRGFLIPLYAIIGPRGINLALPLLTSLHFIIFLEDFIFHPAKESPNPFTFQPNPAYCQSISRSRIYYIFIQHFYLLLYLFGEFE